MLKKIEHIGIAISNLEEANELFGRLFGKNHYKVETVESENVSTSFFQLSDSKIELLESTSESGVISKYISKKGQGIHHIAFEVDDLHAEMERLKSLGFILLNETPKVGADNKMVCFLHPKSTSGILVELCQEIAN